MPHPRSRHLAKPTRSTTYKCVLALVVAALATTLSVVAATPHHSDRAEAAAVRAHGSTSAPTHRTGSASLGPVAPGQLNAVTPGVGTAKPAVHTMSMDAPIQGGLSAHQEQAQSARVIDSHGTPASAARSAYWTPAMGRTAAARALSWLGLPYSWAGGNAAGPTPGRCVPGDGGDLDCHVVGFDCSGLSMYAWGPYAALPHLADTQRAAGAFHPSVKQLLPGDLVFFAGYLAGGTGHVAIYIGKGMVVEAPQSGALVHRAPLSELMADDGAYRGAVRPLTAPTPTLAQPRTVVAHTGGIVVLRGTHLAGVDTVHVGGRTVKHFLAHTDSAVALRVPAHDGGTLPVTVSTSWMETSRPVDLTWAKATPKPVDTAPKSSTSSAPPSTTTTTTPPPSTTTTTTPPPSTTAPSTTAPAKGSSASTAPSSGSSTSGSSTSGAAVSGADAPAGASVVQP